MRTQIDLAGLLAMYGKDLAVVFSHLPQDDADRLMDELAAGVKQEADGLRMRRAAGVRKETPRV